VQCLVIDIDFAHFRLDSLSELLFESLGGVLCHSFVSKFSDAGLFNKLRQSEWYLMNASLILQVAPFLGPMSRYRYRIPHLLHLEQEDGISSGHIPRLHQVRPLRHHLQVKNFHLLLLFTLLLTLDKTLVVRMILSFLFNFRFVLFGRLTIQLLHRGVLLLLKLRDSQIKPIKDLLELQVVTRICQHIIHLLMFVLKLDLPLD